MKKVKILILFLFLSFSTFGCTSKQDINDLVLISSIGIDKSENGFKMVAQIVNRNILVPNPPQVTPVVLVITEGETMFDCLLKMIDVLPNRPYMINLQLLVFSEDIAKDGIYEYIDFFMSHSESQHEYNVLITKGVTAEEFLGQISVFSIFPTRVLISKLKASVEEYGFAKETFVEEIVNSFKSDSINLLISSVTVEGDLKEGSNVDQNKKTDIVSKIKISDLGVFDGDKLVGWLNKEEAVAYNFVRGKIKSTVLVVDGQKNNKISCYINKTQKSLKVEIKDGKPKVKVEVKFNVAIIEDTSLEMVLDKAYEEDVKKKLEEKLVKQIKDCLEKSKKEFKVDIFNFSDEFYKKEPAWWKENKDNYKQLYENLEVEIIVLPNIKRTGI